MPYTVAQTIPQATIKCFEFAINTSHAEIIYNNAKIKKHHDGEISLYKRLNKLISKVNTQLWQDQPERHNHLYYTEMLLFSIADNIVFNDIVSRLNITISK